MFPFPPMPLGQPAMSFGLPFMPPANDMFGSTQYKYVTPDGGPPMEGAVPTGSAFDPPKPGPFGFPGNCVPGAIHPFGPPNLFIAQPCPFAPPAAFAPAPAPTLYQCTSAPPVYSVGPIVPAAPAPTPATSSKIPPPPPPPSHSFGGTNDERVEPVEGNRVKGQLATFPDNSAGYIFEDENVTFHLFHQNVLLKYPPVNNVVTIQGEPFTAQHAPGSMTFAKLIQRIDCITRAEKHPPYDKCGYPRHGIGIQELLDMGHGQFMLGTKIMLTDRAAMDKLGERWPDSIGNAWQEKPRYIVRLPV